MSPGERKLWAASHALPPQYLLVTRSEMEVMGAAMAQQRNLAGALQRTFKECEVILAYYWKNEPDLTNGVAAAVFDANRYKKAADLLLVNLGKIRAKLDGLPPINPPVCDTLYALSKELAEQIAFLQKQIALRRDRKGSS